MLDMIDWNEIYRWKIWQYMKWVTGAIIATGIIFGIYDHVKNQNRPIYRKEWQSDKTR